VWAQIAGFLAVPEVSLGAVAAARSTHQAVIDGVDEAMKRLKGRLDKF